MPNPSELERQLTYTNVHGIIYNMSSCRNNGVPITFWCTGEFAETLNKRADSVGMDRSTYIRSVLNACSDTMPIPPQGAFCARSKDEVAQMKYTPINRLGEDDA